MSTQIRPLHTEQPASASDGTLPIADVMRVIRARWLWIVALTIATAAIVYLVEATKPQKYAASSLVNYGSSSLNLTDLVGIASPSTSQGSNGATNPQLATAAALAVNPSIAQAAAARVGHQVSGTTVLGDVSVTAGASTNILTITATDTSAPRATAISRAYASAYVASQYQQFQSSINTAISKIDAQITTASHGNGTAKSVTLDSLYQRRTQLQQVAALTQLPVSVGLLATQASAAGPHATRTALLAAIAAALLALILAVTFDRVRTASAERVDLARRAGS